MAYLLSDYITRLGYRIPTITTIPQAAQIEAINTARREIAMLDTKSTMVSTTFPFQPGVSAYPFLSNMIYLYYVRTIVGSVVMPLKKVAVGDRLITNIQGIPERYWIESDIVYYDPVPSAAYNTRWDYTTVPTDLVNLTDVDGIFGPTYLDAIIYSAAKHTALMDANIQLATAYDGLMKNYLATTKKGQM